MIKALVIALSPMVLLMGFVVALIVFAPEAQGRQANLQTHTTASCTGTIGISASAKDGRVLERTGRSQKYQKGQESKSGENVFHYSVLHSITSNTLVEPAVMQLTTSVSKLPSLSEM